MSKAVKYEVTYLMSHQNYVDRQLKEKQDQGWEIAGDILLKNKDGWCGNHYFHIPMKRRVKPLALKRLFKRVFGWIAERNPLRK